jgi:hypothetical protein
LGKNILAFAEPAVCFMGAIFDCAANTDVCCIKLPV